MITHHLQKLVKDNGPIRLDHFISEVLYNDCHGYYKTCIPIGKEGDYTTAPEISQVFGELIGIWIISHWTQAGRPGPVHLIELGPGLGTLMSDILRTLKIAPELSRALHVHMVEVSPSLIAKQQEKLINYPNITWHTDIQSVPPGYSMIIANEFFDALPIRQFIKINNVWHEKFVTYNTNKFDFINIRCAPTEANFANCADHTVIETCPGANEIASIIANRLQSYGGTGLFIDYGDELEDWHGDTLQALHKHQFNPIFENLGVSDLTHQVDFYQIKKLFIEHGLTTFGTITQGQFLSRLGIETRINHLSTKCSEETKAQLNLSALRLIGCQHMGQLFKVLSVTTDSTIKPVGFDDTNI